MRDAGHRLDAAGDDAVGKAAHDPLGGHGDGLQAGGAEAVDGLARHLDRQAGLHRRHPADVHALLGLREGAAEVDVVDGHRIDAGPLDAVP